MGNKGPIEIIWEFASIFRTGGGWSKFKFSKAFKETTEKRGEEAHRKKYAPKGTNLALR